MIFLLLPLLFICICWFENSQYKTIHHTVHIDKLKELLKVVQISDFHNNPLISITRLIEDIRSIEADFIILTGDIIDRNQREYTYSNRLLKGLSTLNIPIYFIMGNHEHESCLKEAFIETLKDYKVVFLDENIVTMHGITMGSEQSKYCDVRIIHNPMDAIKHDFQLTISGHTHGGQVNWFGLGAIKVPGQSGIPKYQRGCYQLSNQRLMYIDSGLGYTFLPIRFLRRVQYTCHYFIPKS